MPVTTEWDYFSLKIIEVLFFSKKKKKYFFFFNFKSFLLGYNLVTIIG